MSGALSSGEHLGNWILDARLGSGAQGSVYRAYSVTDKARTEPFALKWIEPDDNADRLLVEPTTLSRLRHPNIISLHDFFPFRGGVALLLEYIPGQNLEEILTGERLLSAEDVSDFLLQMAEALSFAHDAGYLHRDIKPANILVDRRAPRPRYVLADFGISDMVGRGAAGPRRAGTLRYMSPEQLGGRPSPASDIWSVGVIAYRMLSGEHPFPSAPDVSSTREAIRLATPKPLGRGDSEDLEAVITRVLSRDLSARIVTAEDLRSAVRAAPTISSRGTSASASSPSYHERRLEGRMHSAKGLMTVFALFSVCTGMVLPVLVGYAGVWMSYRFAKDPGALASGLVGLVLRYCAFALSVTIVAAMNEEAFRTLLVFQGLIALCLVFITAWYFRLSRELALAKGLRQMAFGSHGSEAFLEDYLKTSSRDIAVRLALARRYQVSGRYVDAILHARAARYCDPFHFEATLIEASSCFAVGLDEECLLLCNGYLAVVPDAYDFDELRRDLEARKVRPMRAAVRAA